MASPDPVEVVLGYHQRTKHHLHGYARGPGYMDWATQPDPFRRYEGARLISLDLVPAGAEPGYDRLFDPEPLPARALDRAGISQFLQDCLALSAWKEVGEHRWSLRVNPSSGNLHPTEGYLLAGPIPGLLESGGLFHYAPRDHALEERRSWSREAWDALGLPPGSFLMGLASIYWRESWKYGERAFRYCQHDAGHALGAVAISARALGWQARLAEGTPDALLARLLGVAEQSGPEAEHADCLVLIGPGEVDPASLGWARLEPLSSSPPVGTPNALSRGHEDWPIIEVVSESTERAGAWAIEPAARATPGAAARPPRTLSARRIIQQRRSAVAMDGLTSIGREEFLGMLDRVSPARNPNVFGSLPWRPAVHLALFVHRVRDIEPGLYFLVRDPEALPELGAATRPEFRWSRVHEGLYLLAETGARQTAQVVSCQQEIAADGAFALGMIARFEPELRARGAWFYRRLHWEAGAIGQVLYLEAEAAGIRATGIGCFFDDAMHNVLGLRDATFQTVYHFTVGGSVEDTRLRTAPPYGGRPVGG